MCSAQADVRFVSIADISQCNWHVRFSTAVDAGVLKEFNAQYRQRRLQAKKSQRFMSYSEALRRLRATVADAVASGGTIPKSFVAAVFEDSENPIYPPMLGYPGMTVEMSDAPFRWRGSRVPVSWNRRDLCNEYKFWAVRQAISSVPKLARRNQRTATEPTALSAWACRQRDNKRSTLAHAYAHLKASRTPLPVRRERGRVSQPLTPSVRSVMPHTSAITCVDSVFDS